MDWSDLFAGLVLGVAGSVIAAVLAPADSRLIRVLRRRIGDRPFSVSVVTDPRRMPLYPASLPLSFYFPQDREVEPPTYVPHEEWWAWAHENGGVDAGESRVTVYVTTTRAGVALTGIRVLDAASPVTGGVIRTPDELGGGFVPQLTLEVDLNMVPPSVVVVDEDNKPRAFKPYRLEADDQLIMTVFARASADRHDWVLELDLLVDGVLTSRQLMQVGGQPFVTVGERGVGREAWATDFGDFDDESGEWDREPTHYWRRDEPDQREPPSP